MFRGENYSYSIKYLITVQYKNLYGKYIKHENTTVLDHRSEDILAV